MELPIINRELVDFTSDTEVVNIGYNEGIYENRPYRVEVWASYDIEVATVFISNIDLTENNIRKYLIDSKVINIIEDNIKIQTIESDGNEFYSINIPLKDRTKVYNEVLVDIKPYDL